LGQPFSLIVNQAGAQARLSAETIMIAGPVLAAIVPSQNTGESI